MTQGTSTPSRWKQRLLQLKPEPFAVSRREVMRAGTGAFIAVLVTGICGLWLMPQPGLPWLIAPMGASAVLLFAVPASPLAQPWPLVASSLLATLVAVTCRQWIDYPLLGAAVAAGLTIMLMFPLRCVHPPAGAVALLLAMGGEELLNRGYALMWYPVLPNVLALLLCGVVYHRLTGYRYPHGWHAELPAPVSHSDQGAATLLAEDLDAALAGYGEFLDVSRDDLMALFRLMAANALHRQLGQLHCADVMTRNPVALQYGDYLEETWALFQQHRYKAIPVVDRAGRVIGIVTREDILSRAGVNSSRRAARQVQRFVRRVRDNYARKPEVVGQVMSTPVVTLRDNMPLLEAVTIFAGHGHSHFPVIDDAAKLTGIIARSDVLRALYEGITQSLSHSDHG